MKKIIAKGDWVQVGDGVGGTCLYPEFLGRVGVVDHMYINASYFHPKSSFFIFATTTLYNKDGSTETKTFRADNLKIISSK